MFEQEKSKAYYLREFKKIDEGKFSWNWAAFTFGYFWLLYRKVYSGVRNQMCFLPILILIPMLYGVALAICKNKLLVFLIFFGIYFSISSIITGALGNDWYYSAVKEKIRKGYHLYDGYCPVDNDLWKKLKKHIQKSFTWAATKNTFKNPAEAPYEFVNTLEEEERKEVETAIPAIRDGYSTEINEENISKLI